MIDTELNMVKPSILIAEIEIIVPMGSTADLKENVIILNEKIEEIVQYGISTKDLECVPNSENVDIDYHTIEGVGDRIIIPNATTKKAGVMSADDKKDLADCIHLDGLSFASGSDYVSLYSYNKDQSKREEIRLKAANSSSAGVMSAEDKQQLNESMDYSTALSTTASPTHAILYTYNKDQSKRKENKISPATHSYAGVMTADDKKALDNVPNLISEKIAEVIGAAPETFDTLEEVAQWIENDETGAAAIANSIAEEKARAQAAELANTNAINAEVIRATEAENKLQKGINAINTNAEKTHKALINGDTIVGQTREIYSRTGKVDNAMFLQRTTAGGTSISDGVASVRKIGGNFIKNLVDGTLQSEFITGSLIDVTKDKGLLKLTQTGLVEFYVSIKSPNIAYIPKHKYYSSVNIYNNACSSILLSIDGGRKPVTSTDIGQYINISMIDTIEDLDLPFATIRFTPKNNEIGDVLAFVKNWLLIDLTEMFGNGNEPTKEECDRIFNTTSAIPKGINFATPQVLKSSGYNQFNPINVLANKIITNNTIVDGDKNIAIVECVPCNIGIGENNGYVIGYGEGDNWSDEGIEVYLTPLNPMTTEGELYLQKLEKDTTYGTYLPNIKGYLLITTPTFDKLCAHLHWSGDRAKTDYEEYVESVVSLPDIPQMSEWGLAGISSSGIAIQDRVDLENKRYIKRIGRVDLGNLTWSPKTMTWCKYVCGDKVAYVPKTLVGKFNGSHVFLFPTSEYIEHRNIPIKSTYNADADTYTITQEASGYNVGEVFTKDSEFDRYHATALNLTTGSIGSDYVFSGVISSDYNTTTAARGYYGTSFKSISTDSQGRLRLNDSDLANKTSAEIKEYLKGQIVYYVLLEEEEYPIVTKSAPNYIGSDYGVEEFVGSTIPVGANTLYYMRSLVGETRNFIDRLIAGLGVSDITAAADKIVAAVNQHSQVAAVNEELNNEEL